MLYTLTSAFTRLNESTGTIQNSSSHSIEVSDQNILGTGVILKPGEKFSFSGATFYARCEGAKATVRVVPFAMGSSGGSSGGSSSGGSADYPGDVDDIWDDSGGEPFDDEFDKVIDDIYGFDTP